jgi:hypothetical protein
MELLREAEQMPDEKSNTSEKLQKIVVDNVREMAVDSATETITKGYEEAVGIGPKIANRVVGIPFALVTVLMEQMDEMSQEALQRTREDEACPHIKLVSGLHGTGAVADVVGFLNNYTGVAWKNTALSPWYFHPDPEFGPQMIAGFVSYADRPTKQITENGRNPCSICASINARRQKS